MKSTVSIIKKSLLLASFLPCLVQAQVLEEIVVTAQKRTQSLQEVPIAITAFSGGSLTEINATHFNDLIDRVPGISSNGGGGSNGSSTISVRGITTNDFGNGGDPSVGMYRNSIYDPRMSSFHDIERVEVLRGPQGMLFGRASSSGAINMITAKADPSALGGEVMLGGGERGQERARLVLNAPLSDSWALRFSGMYDNIDGFVDNSLGGDDLGWDEQKAARLSLSYRGERLNLDAIVDYEDRDQSGILYSLMEGDTLDTPATGDINTVASNLLDDTSNDNDLTSFILLIDYDFDFARLSSLTGYRESDAFYREDFDGSPLELIDYMDDGDSEYLSQELRLVSTGGGSWDWFVGASAFREEYQNDFQFTMGEETVCTFLIGLPSCNVFPGFTPNEVGYQESGSGEGKTTGYAAYGEVGYSFAEAWRLSVGLRYNYDEKEYTQISNAVPDGGLYDIFGRFEVLYGYETPAPVKSDDDWSNTNARVLLEYAPNDDLNLYASFTQGSKPGGFDSYQVDSIVPGFPTSFSAPNAEVNSFDPEEVDSYEIGAKGFVGDGSFGYSVSAYYYDYTDLQQQVLQNLVTVVENVGEATGKGVEGEFDWQPHDQINLSLGLAWSDTEIDDIGPETCTTLEGGSCNGNALPVSPEFTAFFTATGIIPLGDNELYGTVEYSYSDDYYSSIDNSESTAVESSDLVNFRVGFNYGDNLTIRAFVENVTDEAYYTNGADTRDLIGVLVGQYPITPRTWGADIIYRFGD
ncbi:MAG: TonB-dependent receptor [Pseudomonadota bacterium]